MDEDLDDLLDDISTEKKTAKNNIGGTQVGSFKYEVPGSIKVAEPSLNVSGGKCYPLFIGGSSLQDGFT